MNDDDNQTLHSKEFNSPLHRFLSLIKGFADTSKIKISAVHWEFLTGSRTAVFIKCDFLKRPRSGRCLHSAAKQLQWCFWWLWGGFAIKSSAPSMFENQNHNWIKMQDVDFMKESLQRFSIKPLWLRVCQKKLPQSKWSSSCIRELEVLADS